MLFYHLRCVGAEVEGRKYFYPYCCFNDSQQKDKKQKLLFLGLLCFEVGKRNPIFSQSYNLLLSRLAAKLRSGSSQSLKMSLLAIPNAKHDQMSRVL